MDFLSSYPTVIISLVGVVAFIIAIIVITKKTTAQTTVALSQEQGNGIQSVNSISTETTPQESSPQGIIAEQGDVSSSDRDVDHVLSVEKEETALGVVTESLPAVSEGESLPVVASVEEGAQPSLYTDSLPKDSSPLPPLSSWKPSESPQEIKE